MIVRLIAVSLVLLVALSNFSVASKEDRESSSNSRSNKSGETPESRERVISTGSSRRSSSDNRNDFNVRKDILETISSRFEGEATKPLNRRFEDPVNTNTRDRSTTEKSTDSSSTQKKKRPQSNKRNTKLNDSKCGKNITLYTSVEITSPSYPSKYPPDSDCRWTINAQKGQTIRIEIFRLNIERDDNCKFDYLDIRGVRKLCGKVSDSVINVNSSSVELRFRSDQNNEDFGFHLRVSAESQNCVREVNVTNYAFATSPNYPANYDDLMDCWTLIRAESSTTLVLTFDSLFLEHDSQCAYDYLEVFDSDTATNSLGKLCEKPENVTLSLQSSRNVLLLHFHSDQLLNNKGFRAEVTTSKNSVSGCNWKVNWNNMSLNSPNYPNNYPPNLNCELSITAPSKDERIVIIFDWVHFETGAKCDNKDRLEIWETEKTVSRVVCGRMTQNFKYVSQTRTIKLKFVSDGFAEFPGFTSRIAYINLKADPRGDSRVIQPLMRSPENASVIVGTSHVLNCDPLKNVPISWYKNDKKIMNGVSIDGKTLIIREFTSRSEGRYVCKFGHEQREAWLTIKKTNCPSVIFRKRPKDMSVSEGDFVVLECNVVDAKSPVKWEKDGRRLSNNSRVNQLHNGYLLLDPSKPEDSGIYFCVANPEQDCMVKSGARVSVHQRVNVKSVCGLSHTQLTETDVSKIIGGTEASKSAFPWHVMFWDYKRKAFCGGALLNERWVLTAAHCFETGPESAIEIKLGKYDQTTTEETEIVTKIAEVIRHPDFSRETFDNDIALVRLSQHISFTPHIIPICLVEKRDRRQTDEYFLRPNSALRIGHVTGWGQLKENGPQPRFLQELRVPIVEESKCRASTAFKVTSNMFCAGYGKEVLGDACKGDSGGPFVVQYKSRWIILGVVSWGEGCGRTGKYGFYTRVNNYLDWINAIIKL